MPTNIIHPKIVIEEPVEISMESSILTRVRRSIFGGRCGSDGERRYAACRGFDSAASLTTQIAATVCTAGGNETRLEDRFTHLIGK